MVKAVQNYVNLVNGLTKMTRDSSVAMAKALLAQAGLEGAANDVGERVTKLAEEILVANRANRELVENLISGEVDKAAARWGFVRSADLEALREEVAELHQSLNATKAGTDTPPPGPARKAASRRTADSGPSQQPPLGGVPAQERTVAEPSVLVPSEPLPYEPGPIQPNAAGADSSSNAAATSAVKRSAAAKKSAAKKTATTKTATTKTATGPAVAKKRAVKPAAAKRSAKEIDVAEPESESTASGRDE